MPTRRDFIELVGFADFLASTGLAPALAPGATRYPIVTVTPMDGVGCGVVTQFACLDAYSPKVLTRLGERGFRGAGPDGAYGYNPEPKLLTCLYHWTTFNPAKADMLVVGHSIQRLPQMELRGEKGLVQLVGVGGLIYGCQPNTL